MLLAVREREVFRLVATGMPNKQVPFDLGITEKTIKVHRRRLMQEMGAQSLADLVHMAEKLGVRSSIPVESKSSSLPCPFFRKTDWADLNGNTRGNRRRIHALHRNREDTIKQG